MIEGFAVLRLPIADGVNGKRSSLGQVLLAPSEEGPGRPDLCTAGDHTTCPRSAFATAALRAFSGHVPPATVATASNGSQASASRSVTPGGISGHVSITLPRALS